MSDCKKYIEMINSLTDSELEADREAELHAHMENCSDCRHINKLFLEITGSLSENLAEPPEKLSKVVMSKIRSEKKPRHIIFTRFTALAACIVLVVLVGSKFGWSSRNEISLDDNNGSTQLFGAYSEREAAAEGSDYDVDIFPSPHTESNPDSGIQGNPEENLMRSQLSNGSKTETLQEQLDLLFNSAEISLYKGKPEASDPIRISGGDPGKLAEFLSCASADDIMWSDLSLTPDYTLVFDGEQTLLICFPGNGGILCLLGGDTAYHATATAAEFHKYIESVL